jgi:hypothetical protein
VVSVELDAPALAWAFQRQCGFTNSVIAPA